MNQQDNAQDNTNDNQMATGESALEVQRFPEHFKARVAGKVQHRVGDGPLEDMPVGTDVQVDTAIASYVLSWVDAENHPLLITLAKREFEHYVDSGDIEIAK
ncbi:hypothetical protein SDC9_165750 [bioreactor metagenome]|uniref:Uncharacterized protein n=1 Tax=bioreactor metagenome TaxID=1076179 RepID=A0A645FXL7_9ZZZZ